MGGEDLVYLNLIGLSSFHPLLSLTHTGHLAVSLARVIITTHLPFTGRISAARRLVFPVKFPCLAIPHTLARVTLT